jgi:signal-transduction protein with cAMP-binding, CBS, and nucleotidyltransferase domain
MNNIDVVYENENNDWSEEIEFINLLEQLNKENFPQWLTINDLIVALELEKVITITDNSSLYETVHLLRSQQIGALVVTSKVGAMLGIFTERDLLNRVMLEDINLKQARLKDYMTNSPKTIPHTESIGVALHYFAKGQYRHLPITVNGKLTYMLSVKDLLRYLALEFRTEALV